MPKTVEKKDGKYRVTCSHGNLIRGFDDALHRTTDRRPECGCYEIEVCQGCHRDVETSDCGCPCGTAMNVRERDGEGLVTDTLDKDGKRVEGEPHLWIQWKGTDVCCDIYCKCGAHLHFDGDFLYALQCPHCKQVYETGSHVPIYPVEASDHEPKQIEPSDDGFDDCG